MNFVLESKQSKRDGLIDKLGGRLQGHPCSGREFRNEMLSFYL